LPGVISGGVARAGSLRRSCGGRNTGPARDPLHAREAAPGRSCPPGRFCCYPACAMSIRDIDQAFQKWRTGGEAMVLATVYDTIGSTYSNAGHRILIAANGDYQGLVSGGCLEGDLAERSREVIKTMQPQAVTYDMRDEADDLWGLGVGCNG